MTPFNTIDTIRTNTNTSLEIMFKNLGTTTILAGSRFRGICAIHTENEDLEEWIEIFNQDIVTESDLQAWNSSSRVIDTQIETIKGDLTDSYTQISCENYLLDKNQKVTNDSNIKNNIDSIEVKVLSYTNDQEKDNNEDIIVPNSSNWNSSNWTRDFAISDFYLEKKEQLEKIQIHPNYQWNLNDFVFVNAYFTVHNYWKKHTNFPRTFAASFRNWNWPADNSVSSAYIEWCRANFSQYNDISNWNSCIVKTEFLMSKDEDISEYEFLIRIWAPSSSATQEELYEKDANYTNNRVEKTISIDEVTSL